MGPSRAGQYQHCDDANGAFLKNVDTCTACLEIFPSNRALVSCTIPPRTLLLRRMKHERVHQYRSQSYECSLSTKACCRWTDPLQDRSRYVWQSNTKLVEFNTTVVQQHFDPTTPSTNFSQLHFLVPGKGILTSRSWARYTVGLNGLAILAAGTSILFLRKQLHIRSMQNAEAGFQWRFDAQPKRARQNALSRQSTAKCQTRELPGREIAELADVSFTELGLLCLVPEMYAKSFSKFFTAPLGKPQWISKARDPDRGLKTNGV